MIYFTSDLHFGHDKIIEYEKETRGHFSSVEDMNEYLIGNWNSVVKDEDTVFILGDMFMGSIDYIDRILPRLHGKKILIRGNHDTDKKLERISEYIKEVYDIYNLKIGKKTLVLCHYPLREWFAKEHGSVHLYGHVHSNEHRFGLLQAPNSYHVGVDTNELLPVSIDHIMEKFFPCKHGVIKKRGNEGNFCINCGKEMKKYNINGKVEWI